MPPRQTIAKFGLGGHFGRPPPRKAGFWIRLYPSCRRCSIFLFRPTRHDLQRLIRQRPLQRLGLIPRRTHLNIALFIGSRFVVIEPTLKAGESFANKGTSDSPHVDLAALAKRPVHVLHHVQTGHGQR